MARGKSIQSIIFFSISLNSNKIQASRARQKIAEKRTVTCNCYPNIKRDFLNAYYFLSHKRKCIEIDHQYYSKLTKRIAIPNKKNELSAVINGLSAPNNRTKSRGEKRKGGEDQRRKRG